MTARHTAWIAAALMAASVGCAAAQESAGGGDRIRFSCKAEGDVDISMSAKYEKRSDRDRRKFSVEFEAAPDLGYKAGDKLGIRVKDAKVGSVELVKIQTGDLVGDFNLDTNPNEGDAEPFPGNFPKKVGKNTDVAVLKKGEVVLGCSLR